jgi:pimeloyl-ACP methyl ester carboxylesterase
MGRAERVSLVNSRDGTEISFWSSGRGPALVVVHGTPADHTRWKPLLPYLEPHFTVHAIDRRGRGTSGDAPEYDLAREFDDVAAVIDSVAAVSGSSVDLYGHSHGGIVAFGAATQTPNIRKLVLYEGWPIPNPEAYALPAGLEARMDALLADGDRDGVVETLFRELEAISDEDMDAFKAAPSWPGRVAAAHTVTREIRGETGARLEVEHAAKISVPVLLLTGEKSSDPSKAGIDDVANALPDARIVVLKGHEHVADVLAPELFAQHLLAFLGDSV